MVSGAKPHSWASRLLLLGLAVVLLGSFGATRAAQAHGKELSIKVSSFTPDLQEPLLRLYRVLVTYAADQDPVSGARVRFTATREGGGPPMEPLVLEPLNEPGVYAAEVAFPLYGSWTVSLSVEEQGEGEVSFVEEVVPAGPAGDTDEVRQKVLQLFFRFNWRDVATIAVRVSHTMGALVWFGLTVVLLAAYWFLPPASRPSLFRRLSRVFVPASVLSLGLLAASGLYTGIYSAPVKVPGVFDLDVMWRIPFGPAYLATIAFKALALAACGVLVAPMARALRLASYAVPVAGGGAAAAEFANLGVGEAQALAQQSAVFRLAVANAVIGLGLAIAIAVAVYLHYISHLAVFLPE